MLTIRQNLMETIRGGSPDRYVNQYEFMKFVADPIKARRGRPQNDGVPAVDYWGVTSSWPPGTPGPFPIHDAEHIVCKDVTEWEKYVHAPRVEYSAEEWEPYIAQAEAIDRNEYFVTTMGVPGIFEELHYLMEIQNALMAFYEEPEAVEELLNYIGDWELELAKNICKYIKPDMLFHHDDWGSQQSTFLAPAMFREFIKPQYEKVYGYYKSHGVELIVHHSDSYGETIVQDMIDMGIDIWQGVMTTNDINKIIDTYGGQITLMGGIDNAKVDNPMTSDEIIEREVRWSCESFGKKFYIPCMTAGGPGSYYPGVYDKVTEEINKMSKEMF